MENELNERLARLEERSIHSSNNLDEVKSTLKDIDKKLDTYLVFRAKATSELRWLKRMVMILIMTALGVGGLEGKKLLAENINETEQTQYQK